jgi:hypothetical protein
LDLEREAMEIGVRYDLWKHMEVDFASTKEKCREIVFAVKGSGFVPLVRSNFFCLDGKYCNILKG